MSFFKLNFIFYCFSPKNETEVKTVGEGGGVCGGRGVDAC